MVCTGFKSIHRLKDIRYKLTGQFISTTYFKMSNIAINSVILSIY